MPDDPKLCPKCGKPMRRNNGRGACSRCLDGGSTDPIDRQFREVTKACGLDREAILRGFKQQWLEEFRRKVRA